MHTLLSGTRQNAYGTPVDPRRFQTAQWQGYEDDGRRGHEGPRARKSFPHFRLYLFDARDL